MPLIDPSISPARILIIKPSAIGDVVHTLPVLNLVRRRWPGAKIDWLVTPACAGLLKGHPQLNEVILFERRRYGSWWYRPKLAWEFFAWLGQLRRRRYDLVLDLQGLLRSGWLSWCTRAALRVGFANARELGWIFYNRHVAVAPGRHHAVDRYLMMAEAVGCEGGPVEFVFPVTDEDRRTVREMLGDDRPYAVLLPGSNWPTKRWPIRNFAALVGPLHDELGLRAIAAGGPDDVELAGGISGATNLAGRTSLLQLAALLEGASLVIANDSGPMHIAAALGRPLVALFGPTNPTLTGPFGRPECVLKLDLSCSPCHRRECFHQSCMQWAMPETVMARGRRQMQAMKPPEANPEIATGQSRAFVGKPS